MMAFQIAAAIQEIDATCWDAVAGDEIAMTHRWQRVMEASWRGYRPRYLLLQGDQGPLAIAVAKTAQPFGRAGWIGRLWQRFTLMVGAPFSGTHCGVMVRPGTNLAAVLPQLNRALSALAWREKRPLLGISNVATLDLPAWRAQRFLVSARPGVAILDLPADYDDYLGSLSRNKRRELGRLRRRAEEAGVYFECDPLVGAEEQAFALVCEVFAKHGTPAREMPFGAELFALLAREMPGEALLLKGGVGGQLAGVLVCLVGAGALWAPLIGLRYELSRPHSLYFLLTDEAIRWAIARGLRHVYGGLAGARAKSRHGFRLQERWFCYRANPLPLHNALTSPLALALRLKPGVARRDV